MNVVIKLFASVREAVGERELRMDFPDGSTARDVQQAIVKRYPATKTPLESGLVAVNQEYVQADTVLRAGDEVAFIPPVSGGSEAAGAAPGEESRVQSR